MSDAAFSDAAPVKAEPPKSRSCTPCGCVLVMVVIGVVIPVAGWMVWTVRAARLVEDEMALIREAGEPADVMDLEMAFIAPPPDRDATRLYLDAMKIVMHPSFQEASKGLPIVGTGPEIPPVGETWEQLAEVEQFLADHGEVLDKLHEAARMGGGGRYEKDFDQGFNMELDEVQNHRTFARLLALEIEVRAHRGDSAGAAKSLRTLLATTWVLEKEPLLVSQLVRIALAGIARDHFERALGRVEFSDEDLAQLQEDLRAEAIDREEREVGVRLARQSLRLAELAQ